MAKVAIMYMTEAGFVIGFVGGLLAGLASLIVVRRYQETAQCYQDAVNVRSRQ